MRTLWAARASHFRQNQAAGDKYLRRIRIEIYELLESQVRDLAARWPTKERYAVSTCDPLRDARKSIYGDGAGFSKTSQIRQLWSFFSSKQQRNVNLWLPLRRRPCSRERGVPAATQSIRVLLVLSAGNGNY